ncbi:DUF397 domain-containing protein [Streptomyces sp. ICBB 8177]|uniref:DUF397 domain-containing protein n=1 Tax=Streptomyces sp. ICBB 8177 TaxID=563922 RepID=UPI000D679864|nr:DUF397 domain-containing protein [Streptomyces sp. ICBB 8177]PWI41118.1 DUF397 domain-containing protein [Streptomyces sp. ICBB 8177]
MADGVPPLVRWRKSTYSGGTNDNCVEVAVNASGVVPVRDSKDPDGPALSFRPAGWASFIAAVKQGELG